MTDRFEARISRVLLADAEDAVRPFDAVALATAAMEAARTDRARGRTALNGRYLRLFGLLALLLLAAAAAIWAGSQRAPIDVPWSYRGEIVQTDDLLVARGQPKLVTLTDGRVLIVGGDAGSATTAEWFDPVRGEAGRIGPLIPDTYVSVSDAAMLGDGRVLVVGEAFAPESSTAVAVVFDPARNEFVEVGPLMTPRAGAKLTTLDDGRVLVSGGAPPDDPNTTIASLEVFDPATNTFIAAGELVTPRWLHAAVRLPDGRVLVVGGETSFTDGSARVLPAEVYDPLTARSTELEPIAGVTGWPTVAVSTEGEIVVFGQDGIGASPTTTRLDPVTLAPQRVDGPPVEVGSATPMDDGRIFVAGAWLAGDYTAIYDPIAGTTTPTELAGGWYPTTIGLLDGRVLLVGGLEDGETHGESGSLAPPVRWMAILE